MVEPQTRPGEGMADAAFASMEPRVEFGLYRRLLGATLRSMMQYRVSFAMQLVSASLITFVEFAALVLVLQRFDGVGGWSIGEVAILYGLVAASFKLVETVASGFDPHDFGDNVRLGRFDQVLLRPAGLFTQVLASKFDLHRIGQVAEGLAILAIGMALSGVDWTPAKLAYLPVVFIGQMAFFFGLYLIGSTVTFWTVDAIEAMNMLTYGGQEMMSYPMHIYQPWLRRTFTYIVPAIFLNYYPALYLLDRTDPLGMPVWSPFAAPVVGLAVLALAMRFWRFGLRHYQSTGS